MRKRNRSCEGEAAPLRPTAPTAPLAPSAPPAPPAPPGSRSRPGEGRSGVGEGEGRGSERGGTTHSDSTARAASAGRKAKNQLRPSFFRRAGRPYSTARPTAPAFQLSAGIDGVRCSRSRAHWQGRRGGRTVIGEGKGVR